MLNLRLSSHLCAIMEGNQDLKQRQTGSSILMIARFLSFFLKAKSWYYGNTNWNNVRGIQMTFLDFVNKAGKRCIILYSVFLLMSGCANDPITTGKQISTGKVVPSTDRVSILDSQGLDAFKNTLVKIVVERNPQDTASQHFYVAKYEEGPEALTYMFWLEMKLIWIMYVGGETEESWLGVRYPSSGQLIDLTRSVVANSEEVGGSSYLVTRDWAAERLFETFIEGDLLIINQ